MHKEVVNVNPCNLRWLLAHSSSDVLSILHSSYLLVDVNVSIWQMLCLRSINCIDLLVVQGNHYTLENYKKLYEYSEVCKRI